jgi:hypothetical protein
MPMIPLENEFCAIVGEPHLCGVVGTHLTLALPAM